MVNAATGATTSSVRGKSSEARQKVPPPPVTSQITVLHNTALMSVNKKIGRDGLNVMMPRLQGPYCLYQYYLPEDHDVKSGIVMGSGVLYACNA